jgi:serine/threonine-protein kinase HipA
MPGTLQVSLGDRLVGTITNLAGDANLFAFDDEYIADPARPVLSQSFLAESGELLLTVPRTIRYAPPFFANLLPEETNVIRTIIARQYKIADRARDFPYLHALGEDLPGAVVIRALDTGGGTASENRMLPQTQNPGERPLRFSLAGVQAKLSASLVGERLTIPMDGLGGSWIVKPATNQWPRLPENEFAVMTLAKAVGLEVPDIRLDPLDEIDGVPRDLSRLRQDEPRLAYSIRRFDRQDGERVHGEDFNQIAGLSPGSKYEVVTSEWLARVVSELCPPEDVEEFIRRLVFGVVVGNGDMHAKNWAVQYPDTVNARLSPMYDFVCTRRYIEDHGLALPIAGARRPEDVDANLLATFARHAELSARDTLRIADDVVHRIREEWTLLRGDVEDPVLSEAIDRSLASVPLALGR